MTIKWADVLNALRKDHGFAGEDDLATVKAFVSEKSIELTDEAEQPLDLDAVFKTKTVKAKIAPTPEPEKKTVKVSRAVAVDAKAYSGAGDARRDYGKKAYDRKVAEGKAAFSCADEAEQIGAFFRLAIAGYKSYPQRDNDEAIIGKTMTGTVPATGGVVVPPEFNPSLVDLKAKYGGLISRIARVERLPSGEAMTFPRRTGSQTVYYPGEAGSITASDPTLDQVSVTPTKYATLTYASSEWLNDAAINAADFIVREAVWSIEKAKEDNFVKGDGTAAYGHAVGLTYKPRLVLEAGGGTWTTDADKAKLAGFVNAAGNAWSEITLANLEEVVGRYPIFNASQGTPGWICHNAFYWNVMARLALAQGGSTTTEVINGIRTPMFLGHPVYLTNSMPAVEGNSQVACLFGDVSMGSIVGEVNGMTVASSEHFAFDTDRIAYRVTTRTGISVHDVGNYHATASSRVAGPICGLITLNS